MIMIFKCVFIFFILISTTLGSRIDENIFDKGYKSIYRIYEDCHRRNGGLSPCLKKKAIAFFDRLSRIDNLPLSDNLELIKVSNSINNTANNYSNEMENIGRSGVSKDEILNDILYSRIANLMNGFSLQINLPKTSSVELKRSMEEGRGKMKKMMGMMMMGMAMKMAALVPISMGILFLIAGKALIISKIALVLSMIIGLKKLLSQKQGNDSHGGWQSGGGGGGSGWDRSLKNVPLNDKKIEVDSNHAQNLAYNAQKPY